MSALGAVSPTGGHDAADPASVAGIRSNHAEFLAEVDKAERHLAAGRYDEAILYAHLAAKTAAHTHCGVFASSRIERLIHAISAAIPDEAPAYARKAAGTDIKRVLHVGTKVIPVGGLSRMISRWMDADAKRINSFALTRQKGPIPSHLTDAITRSGGDLHVLNRQIGSQIDWIRILRKIARQHDAVILHIHCEDLIPLIAFADGSKFPPVLLLNHADHLFWLGSTVSHAVLSLREAAHDITVNRRGVPPERSLYLPTLVEPARRKLPREQARAALGVKPDEQLIISVARGTKYRTIDGVPYADRFIGVLAANPKARVIVAGSGMPADWARASRETGGRIVGVPEQPDVSLYFEAADIYVDSYPFSSSTSLMEAAGYGLPLVTLYTLPHEARLFGINHLGLIGGTTIGHSPEEWEAALNRLIRDPEWRRECAGNALKAVQCAQPPEWLDWLEAVYQRACELPPVPTPPLAPAIDIDTPRTGEPDWRHEAIYGSRYPLINFAADYIGALSLAARLRVLMELRRSNPANKKTANLRLLVPEWLKRRLKA